MSAVGTDASFSLPPLLWAFEVAAALKPRSQGFRRLPCDEPTEAVAPPARAWSPGGARVAGLWLGAAACATATACLLRQELWAVRAAPRLLPRQMLARGAFPGQHDAVPSAEGCLLSSVLSDFSSKERMERSGWLFGWSGRDAFRPVKELYAGLVPNSSYWGFSKSTDAEIALILRGRGFATLDFGNSWNSSKSQVVVFLNGVPQSRAGATTTSLIAKVPFQEGDILRLVEVDGVMVINSIFFDCMDTTIARASHPQGVRQPVHPSEKANQTMRPEGWPAAVDASSEGARQRRRVSRRRGVRQLVHPSEKANRPMLREGRPAAVEASSEAARPRRGVMRPGAALREAEKRAQKLQESERQERAALAKQLQKLQQAEKRELQKAKKDMQQKAELEQQLSRFSK